MGCRFARVDWEVKKCQKQASRKANDDRAPVSRTCIRANQGDDQLAYCSGTGADALHAQIAKTTWTGKKFSNELRQIDTRAGSRVVIALAESLLQAKEGGFPGAVAGIDFIEFPFIFERIDEAVNVRHGCSDGVQAGDNVVRVRV